MWHPLHTTIVIGWCVRSQCDCSKKSILIRQNNRFVFSKCDIRLLCENTHAQLAVRIFFFSCRLFARKKCIQCVKAFKIKLISTFQLQLWRCTARQCPYWFKQPINSTGEGFYFLPHPSCFVAAETVTETIGWLINTDKKLILAVFSYRCAFWEQPRLLSMIGPLQSHNGRALNISLRFLSILWPWNHLTAKKLLHCISR